MRRRINPDELHELFKSLGEAVWYLQHVEDVLHTFLTVRVDIKIRASVSPEQAAEMLLQNRRATLGTAVRIAREHGLLPRALHERLEVFKEESDWLVHRSLHRHGDDLHTPEKLVSFMERIARFVQEAKYLQKAIGTELEGFVVARGVSQAWIEDEATRLLNQARGEET